MARRIVVESYPYPRVEDLQVELVERKGLGHPDTICDAAAEAVSRELSKYYVERFGKVLHHNVDKVLLVGGQAAPRLGGGRSSSPSISLSRVGRPPTSRPGAVWRACPSAQ